MKIDLIVYDFDGVMTNNQVYVFEDGRECVACNRSDGLAVGLLKEAGFDQIIISTEPNSVVLARAKKLKILAMHDCKNKKDTLIEYCNSNGYSLRNVVFVGNDINDKEAMESVGFPICPSDAYEDIKNISCYITNSTGGKGVIRELANLILGKKYVELWKKNIF